MEVRKEDLSLTSGTHLLSSMSSFKSTLARPRGKTTVGGYLNDFAKTRGSIPDFKGYEVK
jgi:hypothetical protein